VFAALIDAAPAGCQVFYRHRRDNCERKAGKIADWVSRWGGAYDAMIVLDTDSLIAPKAMIEMTRRQAAELGLSLIQALSGIIARRSLFSRLQQFANRCYGPIFGNELAAWHGNGGDFQGHNAIIRTAAFTVNCRLPHLAGNPRSGATSSVTTFSRQRCYDARVEAYVSIQTCNTVSRKRHHRWSM
jgi:membrane glycosyltransferase